MLTGLMSGMTGRLFSMAAHNGAFWR